MSAIAGRIIALRRSAANRPMWVSLTARF